MNAEWQQRNLGELASVIAGQSPDGKFYNASGEGLPFYQGKKDFGEKYLEAPTVWTTEVTKIAREGDILMSVRAPVGPVNFATQDCCIGRGLAAIRPLNGLDRNFLFYYLLLQQEQICGNAGAVFPSISKHEIERIPISCPPHSEQQRIVGILDRAFAAIATAKADTEKNLQNARALFESHLQAVFTGRGDGWVDKKLRQICQRVSVGHVGPTSKFYCEIDVGIPFLRSQNVRPGRLDLDGLRYITREFHNKLKKSQLRAGDLVFVRVGANRGDCCSIPQGLGDVNCANIVFARPTDDNARYLERYCQSPHGRSQLLGMTTGSAQGVINTSSVAELVVPLPPACEQERIVGKLDALSAHIRRCETIYQQKLDALQSLKKSVIHEALTGAL